ncbi:hypothetical protein DERP_005858 [Dermatophagoides pteronyssinus]|uniref:Uncharacterized protein n=1 Tax=Dermatophagoides pteronyssinus TaxID=6956 RepID=A0ABQ8J9R4_DERPT|nr:hypothetical protein DERP_005858 [Dermatophagoides pteronyssinus]
MLIVHLKNIHTQIIQDNFRKCKRRDKYPLLVIHYESIGRIIDQMILYDGWIFEAIAMNGLIVLWFRKT